MPHFLKQYPASRLTVILGGLLIVAILATAAVSALVLRQNEIQVWQRQLDNLSLILAEHTSQTMFSAYVVLDGITERAEALKVRNAQSLREQMGTAGIHQMLRDKTQGLPQVDVVTIVADNGDVINFTRSWPAPAINLADRDYFKAHQSDDRQGDFISAPVRNKGNGKWTFYLSRRLNDPAGRMIGLVLVGISVDVFSDFYRHIGENLGEGAVINLYRRDFVLLTRWPHSEALIGTANLRGTTWQVIEGQKKDHAVVMADTPRLFDSSGPRLRMSAPRLVARYPLIVSPTFTADLFLAGWRGSLKVITLFTGGSILVVAVAMALLANLLQRRERAQEEARRLQHAAEAASLAKSSFLATMSHGLRTSMNGILGMSELLLDTPLDEEQKLYAGTVLDSSKQLLAIINNLLDFSKVESGRLTLSVAPFSPRRLTEDVCTLFSVNARVKDIGLNLEVAQDVPENLLGDEGRLKQVLSNLVANGIKFTAHGEVRVSVSGVAQAEGFRLKVAVRDTGIGLDRDARERLFSTAVAQGSATRNYGSSSLGLAICKGLVDLMGGDIAVASEPGQGAEFSFEVPLPIA